MDRGRTREFVQPSGVNELSSIFLAMARMVLIICLLLIDPLASGPLFVVLFLISVARHFLLYLKGPLPDNIYNFLIDLVTPCLYGFLLFQVLSVYQADFLSLTISIFLPAVLYCILFAGEPGRGMGKGIFWGGLFCYVAAFLLMINYSFDHADPAVDKYFLAKKYSVTTGSDAEEGKGEAFYFDLIPVDSISTTTHWETIDPKKCSYYHHSWMYKTIRTGNETFLILDKKTSNGFHHTCSFLLQKVNGLHAKYITEEQYARFEKGDTFHIEQHKGLLGITWRSFR